jgi:threonine dehydratase
MLTLDEVERAAATLRPYLRPTPLRRSALFRDAPVYLKLECWQPTGSFKVRGATNVMASLTPAERARGVVAASAGNHALGLAFAAQALGGATLATVFVPETAPRAKVDKLRRFPVTVHEKGATYDDAVAEAMSFRDRTGATWVHAFEDARTAAGQGTVGLEVLQDLKDVDTIVVPVGGGGLIVGIATAAKALSPGVRVVAVQPEASPALRESLRQGRALLTYPAGPTLADGLAGGIGEIVFAHRHLIDEIVTVSEEETEDAIAALVAEDQVVSEASGAVGVAALRAGRIVPRDGRPVAVVITGGNIDARVLARLLGRYA